MAAKELAIATDGSDSDVDWLVETCLAHTLSLARQKQASSSSSSTAFGDPDQISRDDGMRRSTEEQSSSSNQIDRDAEERRSTEWMLQELDKLDFSTPIPILQRSHQTEEIKPTVDHVLGNSGEIDETHIMADPSVDGNNGKTETQLLMDLLDPETDTQIEAARLRTRVDAPNNPNVGGGPAKPTPPRGVIWNYKLKPQFTSKYTEVEDILENCHDLVLRRQNTKYI